MNALMMNVPLHNLRFDPRANVRKKKTTKEQDDALRNSIKTVGLLVALTIKDDPDKGKGWYVVPKGGRRLRALQEIHGSASDLSIPCLLIGDAPISGMEASMADMMFSAPTHPMDRCEGFQYLIDTEGASIDDLARRFHMEPKQVRQDLSLGRLSPKIRDELRADKIHVSAAQAFTLEPDHGRQEKLHAKLLRTGDLHQYAIRNAILGERRGASKLLKFVGADAYRKAGGALVEDLFGGAEIDHVVQDLQLLRRLVKEKAQALVDAEIAAGFKWAEFEDDIADHSHLWERMSVVDKKRKLTKDEMARSGVILAISTDGTVAAERGVVKPEDVVKTEARSEQAGARAKAKVEAGPSLSGAAVQRLSARATDGVARALRFSPHVALAALCATLAANGHPSPLKVSNASRAARSHKPRPFVATLKHMASLAPSVRLDGAAAIIAETLDLLRNHASEASMILDDGARALCDAMDPKVVSGSMLAAFDPTEYFTDVSATMCIAALTEMGMTPHKPGGKAYLVKMAADAAKKKLWLPRELRTSGYAGPGGKKKSKGRK